MSFTEKNCLYMHIREEQYARSIFHYGVFMLALFIIGIILINPPALVILIWVVFKLISGLLF